MVDHDSRRHAGLSDDVVEDGGGGVGVGAGFEVVGGVGEEGVPEGVFGVFVAFVVDGGGFGARASGRRRVVRREVARLARVTKTSGPSGACGSAWPGKWSSMRMPSLRRPSGRSRAGWSASSGKSFAASGSRCMVQGRPWISM